MFPEYLKLVILSYRLLTLTEQNLNVVIATADTKVQLDQPIAGAQISDFRQY